MAILHGNAQKKIRLRDSNFPLITVQVCWQEVSVPKLMTTLKNRTSSNPVNRHNLPVKGATCQSQVWIDIAAQDLRKYPQLGNCTIALPYIGLPLNPLDDHHFPYPNILKIYVLLNCQLGATTQTPTRKCQNLCFRGKRNIWKLREQRCCWSKTLSIEVYRRGEDRVGDFSFAVH